VRVSGREKKQGFFAVFEQIGVREKHIAEA
jgi:hypothetical protein